MSIRVALHHQTSYEYDRLITLLPQIIRLRPAPHCRTPILSYALKVEPAEQFLHWQQDVYSNYQARLVFPKPTRSFMVEVELLAEMTCINPFDFLIEEQAQVCPFVYEQKLAAELLPYLELHPAGTCFQEYLQPWRTRKQVTADFLVGLNQQLCRDIRYLIRLEPGIQAPEETLQKRSGSCRDSAWLLTQLLRHLGLAARFVSGYLIQLVADVAAVDGPTGPDKDFTDLHAWTEVYIPGAGWIGLDPTSGLLAGEGHIPLACTPNPQNAAPITGAISWDKEHDEDEVQSEFRFLMSVQRMVEQPRVTKPYTEAEWQAIRRAGQAVDEILRQGDVRLTMGGEPTFVASDDFDSPEWNTTALGATKKQRADQLLRRLGACFAPGGLLHFGQGKWYPGESLPRWAYGCYWRRDGLPIWNQRALIAEEGKDYGYRAEDAGVFLNALVQRLGVAAAHVLPGYEDVFYYLWRERQLPVNVDPRASKLDDLEERARLAKLFEQGLGSVVGYALPLRKDREDGANRWESGRWYLRRDQLFLLPGDSAMGYRLPLDSLPWEPPEERHTELPPDPWRERGPLPAKSDWNQRYQQTLPTPPGPAADQAVRTALCIEPRAGRLCVFMPPLEEAEDYLELVAAVEATAQALHMPVQLEGYPPPYDPRLQSFKVTPDPGVIEVNIHPAATWEELETTTTTLYEEARQTHLTAEKFMLDGRHTGTGGGNHIVLGGPTPADSPILRRPDLLRSPLAYWHNHPALSYLFSGLFLGPTSQAPRVDEARNDSLYELELAFRQLPESGTVPPWIVDRVFRHLLIDASGNTHRSEWCIDKLYSPDSSSGRLGLVELRAFEMPPHARMSLVQHLLIRTLVARFWNQPYHQRLVRWGTELHDRFMLPHFVTQDFHDVLLDLQNAGYDLPSAWFAPHREFRFPQLGELARQGIQLELRQAIEPWHVLGEETTSSGTARYVDSSVERLQVKVQGFVPDRYILACNRRQVPLHPTGTNGEYVAGVRYRAWQPPSCLHPTIGVHTPLAFDLIDTWMQRSIGGCTYHVSHPGGRSFDTLPVNANEAEGRRLARFLTIGLTAGVLTVPAAERTPELPFTLDLRQPAPRERPQPEPAELPGRRATLKLKGRWQPELAHDELLLF